MKILLNSLVSYFAMEDYDLALVQAVDAINKSKSKRVCLQLPDGLKPKAALIQDHLQRHTDAELMIWLGSCWGGCDIPLSLQKLNIDLLIQWGHSEYIRAW